LRGLLTGNRDYVRNHPVATKHAMRAFLKAADLCAIQPEQIARRLVDHGVALSTTKRCRR
jgi:NitT/TauT family transport system substrate-binding protein